MQNASDTLIADVELRYIRTLGMQCLYLPHPNTPAVAIALTFESSGLVQNSRICVDLLFPKVQQLQR